MNPENCEGTLAVALGKALKSIQCIRDRVRDGESGEQDGAFDRSFLLESFNQAVEAMSDGVTNLSLASSKPPQPSLQDGEKLIVSVFNGIQAVREAYDGLHKSQDGESGEQDGAFDRSFLLESFSQGMIVASTLLGMSFSESHQPSLQDGEKLIVSVLNDIQALRKDYDGLHKNQDGESGDHDGAFDLSPIWESFNQAVEAMSDGVTNLSLASSKPPQPSLQDGEKRLVSVLNGIQALSEHYDDLLKSRGVTLWRLARDAIVDVQEGVLQLVEVIISSPMQSLTQEQIMSTAGVWSSCDRFTRIPKDNKEALLVVLSSQSEVVKDAVEKMKQILSKPKYPFKDSLINDPDGDSDQDGPPSSQCMSLSEKDWQVISACQGLMKTAAACLRKLTSAVKANGDATEPQNIAQLDDMADISREIRASVDDLALCLYPPMNYTGVENHTCKLAAMLRKLLELIRSSHVCGEPELTWVQFLEGAVDHNFQKAKDLIELDG